MYNYSYSLPNSSISRLDQLLNRNELIYQNLKEKLDGINKSNQNIYKNINHIQTNFSDPYSHESSAIQREPTMKNQSIKMQFQDSVPKFQSPSRLDKIQEHQEITFSEQKNEDLLSEEIRIRRIMQEERLKDLELVLKTQLMLEDQRARQLQLIRRERQQSQRALGRRISSRRAENVRQMSINSQRHAQLQEKPTLEEETLSFHKSSILSKKQKQQKTPIKSNSIYLNKIPKTSITDTEDQMPTFRDSTQKRYQPRQIDEEAKKSETTYIKRLQEQTFHQQKRDERQETNTHQNSDRKYLAELNFQRTMKNQSEKESKRYNYQNEGIQSHRNNHFKLNLIKIQTQNENEGIDQRLGNGNSFIRSQNQMDFTTPYSELNSHFRAKLEQIELVPQCFLFAPFNKVYRSPIIQLKPGSVILQRKSKTANYPISNKNRIVDGLKFKVKNIVTDEQILLKYLFCGEQNLNFEKKQSSKVAIVGGKQVLKKKLHMALLAYCSQLLSLEIQRTLKYITIKIQHQQITATDNPSIIQTIIQVDQPGKRVALMKLQKSINDIYQLMKVSSVHKVSNKKILRMSKILLIDEGEIKWSYNIITSNRYDFDFLRHLKVNKICWSINPLVKHYEDVKETLQSMKNFTLSRKTT